MRAAIFLTALSVLVVACGGESDGVADPRDGGGNSGNGGASGASGQAGSGSGGSSGSSGGGAGASGSAGGGAGGSTCTPTKPFEGAGVTAAYEGPAGAPLSVISVNKYWLYDWTTGWASGGLLASVASWSSAPAVDGVKPYEGDGVTAAYNDPPVALLTVISRNKYWVYDRSAAAWTSSGLLDVPWAGAPDVDGVQPFDGAGVTAAYNNPSGATLTVISKDKYWGYDWATGAWTTSGLLSTAWAGAPDVGGARPFDGDGVTAAYNNPGDTTLTVISKNKYWAYDWATGSWTTGGLLSEAWVAAPAVGCP